MTPQLLIDMPAEGAARLLTLSLLEQLSLHTTAISGSGETGNVVNHDAYRAALNRLRGCITLYREALGSSVPRKARRRLRAIARGANGLRDVDLQLAWLAQRRRPVPLAVRDDAQNDPVADAPDSLHPTPQRLVATEWLEARLARRRASIAGELERLQANTRPFRRFAKRLGVYTTAIRLDDMQVSQSFGVLTGHQLLAAVQTLRSAMGSVRGGGDPRALRRVRRGADHVVYLLEPVASHADPTGDIEQARTLRDDLERLETSAIIASALVDGGRRIGALHMVRRLRATVWPRLGDNASVASNGRREANQADQIGHGLVSLAESLSDEMAEAFNQFSKRWHAPDADKFFADVEYIATALSES